MQLSELDFDLPERLIARRPLDQRDQSRLLVHECAADVTSHAHFTDLSKWLRAGDLLVLNNSHVVPARMVCRKSTGGAVEGLWLSSDADGHGVCMLSGGRLRPGVELGFGDGIQLRLHRRLGAGRWLVENLTNLSWKQLLEQFGSTPLPPYIRRLRRQLGEAEDSDEDRRRYQTIWAQQPGSVAAPTASLHFSPTLLAQLQELGVERTEITLHVGAGTFLPVETERVESHNMHGEGFALSEQAAAELMAARREGRRIIAVGTTACRLLESLPDHPSAALGETELFILPGHKFRWVDGLLTNFHTPKSTLLALVAAFAEQHLAGSGNTSGNGDEADRSCKPAPGGGLERVHSIYRKAIEQEYRFYSYGDASIWLP